MRLAFLFAGYANGRFAPQAAKTLLADTKEYTVIAVRPLPLCIPQLIAADLSPRN
jgi:hypothetical protein